MGDATRREHVFWRQETTSERVEFRARVGAIRSSNSFLIGGALLVLMWLVFRELGDGPQESKVRYLFFVVVVPVAALALLHGVVRFRNRFSVSVYRDHLVAEQIGLFRRVSRATRSDGERYFVLATYRDQAGFESAMGGPKGRGGGSPATPRVRVADLYLADSRGCRQPLLYKFNGWGAVTRLSDELSEMFDTAPPIYVPLETGTSEASACEAALQQRLGYALDETEKSGAVIREAGDETCHS